MYAPAVLHCVYAPVIYIKLCPPAVTIICEFSFNIFADFAFSPCLSVSFCLSECIHLSIYIPSLSTSLVFSLAAFILHTSRHILSTFVSANKKKIRNEIIHIYFVLLWLTLLECCVSKLYCNMYIKECKENVRKYSLIKW